MALMTIKLSIFMQVHFNSTYRHMFRTDTCRRRYQMPILSGSRPFATAALTESFGKALQPDVDVTILRCLVDLVLFSNYLPR